MKLQIAGSLVLCVALAALGLAAKQPKSAGAKTMADHILTPDMVKWGPGPASLPPGTEAAILDGDMAKSGSEFTVRLRVPDGWKVPAHFHPKDRTAGRSRRISIPRRSTSRCCRARSGWAWGTSSTRRH